MYHVKFTDKTINHLFILYYKKKILAYKFLKKIYSTNLAYNHAFARTMKVATRVSVLTETSNGFKTQIR